MGELDKTNTHYKEEIEAIKVKNESGSNALNVKVAFLFS